MIVYQIAGWNEHFESATSRRIEHPSHCYMLNKQHGLGMARIMAHPASAAMFGIWCWIAQSCSQQAGLGKNGKGIRRAGWLTDNGHAPTASQMRPDCVQHEPVVEDLGTPWTADDLAVKFRLPEPLVVDALALFCKIGWMKRMDVECVRGAAQQRPDHALNRTETEQNRSSSSASVDRAEDAAAEPEREGSDTGKPGSNPETGNPATAPGERGSWSDVQAKPKFRQLAAVVGRKLCERTWPEWRRLLERFGWALVISAAEGLPPDKRWPPEAETSLIASGIGEAEQRETPAQRLSEAANQAEADLAEELAAAKIRAESDGRTWTHADYRALRKKHFPNEI